MLMWDGKKGAGLGGTAIGYTAGTDVWNIEGEPGCQTIIKSKHPF